MPLRLTLASASRVGKGTSWAAAVPEARFEPNTEAMLPAATATPAAKLAPFTGTSITGSAANAEMPAPSHSTTLAAVIPAIRVMFAPSGYMMNWTRTTRDQ